MYHIDEKVFTGPRGDQIKNFQATDLEVPVLSHEEMLEKVGDPSEGYRLTDVIIQGDVLTVLYRAEGDDETRILKAKYRGGLELAEANRVIETYDGRYKMTRIHPNEGERMLNAMDGVYTRIERGHTPFEVAEIVIGEEEDGEGNLKGVGLVWSPSRFWPTRYEKEHNLAD